MLHKYFTKVTIYALLFELVCFPYVIPPQCASGELLRARRAGELGRTQSGTAVALQLSLLAHILSARLTDEHEPPVD